MNHNSIHKVIKLNVPNVLLGIIFCKYKIVYKKYALRVNRARQTKKFFISE